MYALSQSLARKGIFSKVALDSKAVTIVAVALDVLVSLSLISLGGAALLSMHISLIPFIGIISLKMALITAGGSGFATAIILIADIRTALPKSPPSSAAKGGEPLNKDSNSAKEVEGGSSQGDVRGQTPQGDNGAHSGDTPSTGSTSPSNITHHEEGNGNPKQPNDMNPKKEPPSTSNSNGKNSPVINKVGSPFIGNHEEFVKFLKEEAIERVHLPVKNYQIGDKTCSFPHVDLKLILSEEDLVIDKYGYLQAIKSALDKVISEIRSNQPGTLFSLNLVINVKEHPSSNNERYYNFIKFLFNNNDHIVEVGGSLQEEESYHSLKSFTEMHSQELSALVNGREALRIEYLGKSEKSSSLNFQSNSSPKSNNVES